MLCCSLLQQHVTHTGNEKQLVCLEAEPGQSKVLELAQFPVQLLLTAPPFADGACALQVSLAEPELTVLKSELGHQ